jgi:anionic cell wall polymer biosynthesis LytR-Cps2A-Psr (LCP) family protein
VKEYVVSNRSSLPEIGAIVGNVTVTVPNDDLAKLGYHAGETAVINKKNIEKFLRSRNTKVDFSNAGRMERQKAYMNAAIDQIIRMLKKKPTAVWNKLEAIEYCMQTNITRSRYIDLTNILSDLAYEEQNFYSPEGEYRMGVEYAEFYVDEEKLLDKVIEIFYIED